METATATTLALKEWGAVVAALLEGRQSVLLRKGGIHEKAFAVRGGAFVLFPTVAHSHAERVRPEHVDLLARGAADVDEGAGTFTVRCGVRLVEAIEVARSAGVAELLDLHIWTGESVQQDRLDFRPRHNLAVLVVEAVALAPVVVARTEELAGCRSWVDLPVDWDGGGAGVRPLAELRAVADRVRRAVA